MLVLECISCINQLTATLEIESTEKLPPEYLHYPEQLIILLSGVDQVLGSTEQIDCKDAQRDTKRTISTAELYRLGALLYLHRSILHTPLGSSKMQELVKTALQILEEIGICTSPWPLFLISCEVVSDVQRIQVLSILEAMQQRRRIGNYEMIRGVIETVWKQSDLAECSQERKRRIDWKSIVDVRPSFI
jgi:hypothetical protein